MPIRADDPSSTQHPAECDLVDYVDNQCTEALANQIEAHLVQCRDCRELVADLGEYPDLAAPDPAYQVSEEEIRTAMSAVMSTVMSTAVHSASADQASEAGSPLPVAEVEEGNAPTVSPLASDELAARRRKRQDWRPMAWAATVLLALGWGVVERNERFRLADSLSTPAANTPIVALQPMDDPLRGAESSAVSMAGGLVLSLADDEPFPPGRYAVALRLGNAEPSMEIDGLETWPAGHLTFFVPPESLTPGLYEVVLRNADGAEWPRRFELHIAP